MSALRASIVGVRAAWQTPDVLAHGLSTLVDREPARRASSVSALHDAPLASRASHTTLAWLTRLAAPRWRNTCLYRSVAECLALRALALPARIVIGVGTSAADGEVIAHAWVECEGVICLATRGQAELERLSAHAGHSPADAGVPP